MKVNPDSGSGDLGRLALAALPPVSATSIGAETNLSGQETAAKLEQGEI